MRLSVPDNRDIIAAVWGALLSLTEEFNWETAGAITPAAISYRMLQMFTEAGAGPTSECKTVDEVNLWHYDSTVQGGAALATILGASFIHGHVMQQSPGALNDQWVTRNFRLSSGTYELHFHVFKATLSGKLTITFERVGGGGGNSTQEFDFYHNPNVNVIDVMPVGAWTEGLFRITGSITGKNANSTGYYAALSLMQVIRTGD